jgi:ER membrane protein complex subunit 4
MELNSGPPSRPKNAYSIPDPPGFSAQKTAGSKQKSQVQARKPPTQEETETLKLKKSWEIALAPGKQVPMQLIMSYMSGNSLQVLAP